MNDNKRSAKRKWKNALIAAALTASMILALPGWSVGSAKAEVPGPSKELVLQNDGKIANSNLTITRAGENPGKQGTITVDLYKVADAVKDQKYDGYTLAVPTGNTFDSVTNLVSSANGMRDANLTDEKRKTYYNTYMGLAEEVAKEVLAVSNSSSVSGNSISGNDVAGKGMLVASGDIAGSASTTFNNRELEAGLYLVIAHGKGLTPAKYIGTENGKLVTFAYSNGYVYKYQPMLIALPMRGTDVTNVFSTAQNAGDWQYAVSAELKAEFDIEKVPLQITKNFNNVNEAVTGKNGCVFQIEAEFDEQKVYSDVVAIEFDGSEQKTFTTAAKIPVGSTVTVTEVYDGAAFDGETNSKTTPNGVTYNETNKKYEVSFNNEYNGISTGGDIVTNSFTKNDQGYGWNNPRPAVSGNDVSANNANNG